MLGAFPDVSDSDLAPPRPQASGWQGPLSDALLEALTRAGEFVVAVDGAGRLLDANSALLRRLGRQRADVGALALADIESALSPSQWSQRTAQWAPNTAQRYEARWRLGDADLQVEVIANVITREPAAYLLVARDISERLRTQSQLAATAERFRALFDQTPVANLLLDDCGRIVQANRAALQLLQVSMVELIGREAVSFLHAEEVATAARLRHVLSLGGAEFTEDEARLSLPDGESAWVRMMLRPWSHGRAPQSLLVLEDFTARKAAHAIAESASAANRGLLESMPVGVAVVRAGNVVTANRGFSRLLGLANVAFEGLSLSHLVAPHSAALPSPDKGDASGRECTLLRSDGHEVACVVQARLLDDGDAIYTLQDVSELTQHRASLARSASELNAVFDSTDVAVLHLSRGRVIRCNAQANRLFGGNGPTGHAFTALLDLAPADAPPAWLAVGSSENVLRAVETRMRALDGTVFWAMVSLRPADIGSGSLPSVGANQIVTVLNIDARKRIEDELRDTRNFLDLVIETLPVMVGVRDTASGQFVSFNRAAEEMTGLGRDRVLGKTWRQAFEPRFADAMTELDRRVIATGQPVDQPRESSVTADGRPTTVHRRVLPIFEPAGSRAVARDGAARRPRYLMSIVDDLSDVMRAEAALHETEARFRELAAHIDAFVFIANAELTKLEYASPAAESLLGIGVNELLADARLVLERIVAEDRPRFARRIPHLLARLRRLRHVETSVRLHLSTGETRALLVRLTPVRGYGGALRVFGIAEDATRTDAVFEQRLDDERRRHRLVLNDVHQQVRSNLQGISELLQQRARRQPEVAEALLDAATRINAISQIHAHAPGAADLVPMAELIRGIFSGLASLHQSTLLLETPAAGGVRWAVANSEAVPFALVINELAGIALNQRGARAFRVVGKLTPRGNGVELRIEYPGKLPEGFDPARVAEGTAGFGLVRALLPRRGARLTVEQLGPLVVMRLELMAPAIRVDATVDLDPLG